MKIERIVKTFGGAAHVTLPKSVVGCTAIIDIQVADESMHQSAKKDIALPENHIAEAKEKVNDLPSTRWPAKTPKEDIAKQGFDPYKYTLEEQEFINKFRDADMKQQEDLLNNSKTKFTLDRLNTLIYVAQKKGDTHENKI